jgi:hypothetical protein
MSARVAVASLALVSGVAMAVDTPEWPPPSPVEARMHELQHVITSADSTPEQRNAARAELVNLLKSPAGQDRDTTNGRPARAAIQPFGRIVKPAESPPLPDASVAHVEVVSPPKPIALPNGAVATPTGNGFAIDTRTGAVLREVPGGYIDPRTGKFTPH